MENIRRLFFDADEAGQFVYAAIHGLTEGKADCDFIEIYLQGGTYDWMKLQKLFPVPFFMNVINLDFDDKRTVLAGLPEILQSEFERIKQYQKTLVPFFEFEVSEKSYLITEQGVVAKPRKDIITSSQVELDAHAGWYNQDIRDMVGMDIYMALKKANHQRFFRKFCPWHFEQNPFYAALTVAESGLVREYAGEIATKNPLTSKELLELLETKNAIKP